MDAGDVIRRLYPFSFRIGHDLRLDYVPARLTEILPEAVSGKPIGDVFALRRPKAIPTWDLLHRSGGTSFEWIGRSKPVVLRGSVLFADDTGGWMILSPVFTDFREILDFGFRLDDFAPYNTAIDALVALSATKSALRDAESLAEALRGQTRRQSEQIEQLNSYVVEQAANSGLGQALSAMLHDLNSQFGAAVMGSHIVYENLGVVRRELASPDPNLEIIRDAMVDILEMNSIVRGSVQRGSEMIATHKTISIDKASKRVRDVQLIDYLHQLVDSMRPILKSKDIRFEISGDDAIQARHPGLLAQIVTNLIENAHRHAFDGRDGGTVTFIVRRSGPLICFRYEDDGVGMDETTLSRHLEPFFTTKPETGGSGLGAYSIASIVRESLQGHLSVESSPGRGTTYDICFPG